MWTSRSGCRAWGPVVLLLLVARAGCSGGEGATPREGPKTGATLPAAGADGFARRSALLVGVGRYAPGSGVPELAGPEQDVELMRQLLLDRFEYAEDEIMVLQDEQATVEAFLRSFEAFLLRTAGPQTRVLLYVSGHGSRVPDASGSSQAEPDGLDSTLLLHDSRAGGRRGQRDLTDDALRSLVAALSARTSHVTVLLDACHSGGGLRDTEQRTPRGVEDGKSPADMEWIGRWWPRGVAIVEDGPLGSGLPEGVVFVSACRRDQRAYEYRVEGEETAVHGAMTWFLHGALRDSRAGDTWNWAVHVARSRLACQVAGQTPTIEGEVDRRLDQSGFLELPGHAGQHFGKVVLIPQGPLLGYGLGARLAALDSRGEKAIGRLEVEAEWPDASRATWIEGPEEGHEGAVRVRLERLAPLRPKLRVAAEDPEVRELLERIPFATRVAIDDPNLQYRIEGSLADGASLFTARDVRLARFSAPVGPEVHRALERALRAQLQWRTVFELGAHRGATPLQVELRAPAETQMLDDRELEPALLEMEGGTILCRTSSREQDRTWFVGEFTLRNPHDLDLYFALYSVSECGQIAPIAPGSGSARLISPGKELSVKTAFVVPEDWPDSRPMLDRYLVIATSDRMEDVSLLSQPSQVTRSSVRMPALLERASLGGSTTRDSGAGRYDEGGWGVTTVDVLVVPPQER